MKPIYVVILGLFTAGVGLYIYKQRKGHRRDKAINGFIDGYISPSAMQSDITFKKYGEITNTIYQKMSQEHKKIQNTHREQRMSIVNVQKIS